MPPPSSRSRTLNLGASHPSLGSPIRTPCVAALAVNLIVRTLPLRFETTALPAVTSARANSPGT